ncbi:HRASLS family protein [Megaselia abdita]
MSVFLPFSRICGRPAILQSRFVNFQSTVFPAGLRHYANTISEANEEKPKKPKTDIKVTLLGTNNATTITSLEEAQKISKRRNLKLVQVQEFDSKTHRPVYKLLSQAELLVKEDLKKSNQNQQKKSEKMLTVGSRIGDNDLNSRLKNIVKWLGKQHEVRVLIEGKANDIENCDKIVEKMEQAIKEPELVGKIVQKRTKGNNYKFSIVPVKQKEQQSTQPGTEA